MYDFFTFLHIIGFIFWTGSLVSMAIILPILNMQLDSLIGQKLIHIFSAMTYPSSIIVLISGIYRSMQINSGVMPKPFWLNYMEVVGAIIILLGIVLTTVMFRKVMKLLSIHQQTMEVTMIAKWLATFHNIVLFILLVILSIIIVTSFRL